MATKRMLAQWQSRRAAAAWNSWLDLISQRCFLRHFTQKMISSVEHKAIFAGLNAWKRYISGGKAAEAEENHKRLLVQRFVKRMRNMHLVRQMNAWASFVTERKRIRLLGKRVMLRFKRKALTASWNGWCDFVEVQCKTRSLVLRVVSKVVNRALSKGMQTWAAMIRNEKDASLMCTAHKRLVPNLQD